MPCAYMKHPENDDQICAETVFTATRWNVLQCAKLCVTNTQCCSFFYSEIPGVCTGCPLKYTILNQTGNTCYSPVRGKNGEMCGLYEFNGHYYQFITDPRSAKDASIQCSHLGGHLVYVETELENSFLEGVSATLSGLSDKKFWIGLSFDPTIGDGGWKWGNGLKTEDSYEGFKSMQPSGNGKCVVMGYRRGFWDDQPCFYLNKFICEIE
ncbi:C-type lectin-like [Mercenaria mercenaria]|uniref:C-type lectin-like n=1 Tax=Mercenaria mercenaria TaxID=6596 RepID=UPI00234ECE3B|nr:C-type lectin-like [Mercenaria mercenaria]